MFRPPDGVSGGESATAHKLQCTGAGNTHLVASGFDDGDVQGALLFEVREGILRTKEVGMSSTARCHILLSPASYTDCSPSTRTQGTASLPGHRPAAAAV
jgi:hypothetical protein